jgi:hypothetical protein
MPPIQMVSAYLAMLTNTPGSAQTWLMPIFQVVSAYLPLLYKYCLIYLIPAGIPYPDGKCLSSYAYKYFWICSDLADAHYLDGECISAFALEIITDLLKS